MRQDEVEGMYTWISYIVPWNEELNAKTILTVSNTTYAAAKRKPEKEKIRLADIRALASVITVQTSNQLS